MTYFKHMRGNRRSGFAGSLRRLTTSLTRRDAERHWPTAIFLGLALVLQIASARDASAAPHHYRVGACLAAKDLPPARKGESPAQYYKRIINELKSIADTIKRDVPKGVMKVDPILLSPEPTMPDPRGCAQPNDKKRDYDIWLELTYEENGSFLFKVSQREGEDLKVIDTNPDPWPDAARTRELLAEIGQRIAAKSVQSTVVPVEQISSVRRGIIFLYDSSGSMQETDRGARNRLGVGTTIGDIVAHSAQIGELPIPFAAVVFADRAEALESKPGSKWFETTPADLEVARTRLASALKDIGNTNIEAAFKEVALLINSRNDIKHWDIVFLTDGAPTAGITDYGKISKLVTASLGDKSTLSVVALHGNDPLHTEEAKLAELVRATMDGTGHSGEIINLKMGDDLGVFRSNIERIAFLINQSTVRSEAVLKCTSESGAERVECELDQSQPHALRFGAAQQVTFIADATALPGGKCTATIENQGLGPAPRTVELLEGQSTATLTDAGFEIVLSRSNDRVFLMIEMTSGRVNGDWQIGLTMDAATARKP